MPESLPSINELNQLPLDRFVNAVHVLFEAAPPLASRLYAARPFESYSALIDAAEKIVANLHSDDLIAVINAHPRLGAAPTSLSALSYAEQGYNKKTPENSGAEEVNGKLQALNDEYEQKFGFRLVVFVNGRSRPELIPVMAQRIASNDRDQELKTGLSEMMAIARDRLKKLVNKL